MTVLYERETKEFVGVEVLDNGEVVTTGVMLSITPEGSRPAVWSEPDIVDGQMGFIIDGLEPGTYTTWVKVTANPEEAVLQAGSFRIV